MRILPNKFLIWLTLLVSPAVLPAAAAQTAATGGDKARDGGTEFVCPVGGEAFRQNVEMFYFPLESLPNGSNPGGQLSDIMVPICPGNGLVLVPKFDGNEGDPEAFADYTPEELAKLPALIASPDYKALSGEANYLKLYWLSGKLGRPAMQRFHLLQHVSWIGKTPEQHRRYLEMFVAQADALIDGPDFGSARRMRAQYYVANALRELGRFDEAKARLGALQAAWDAELAVIRAQRPPEDPNFESDRDYDENDALSASFAEQLAAVEARDNDTFPVSMMGDKWANATCNHVDDSYPPATDLTKANCAKRTAERKAYYANSQKDYNASQALLGNPVKLAQQCKAIPEDTRDTVLAEACRIAEYQTNRDKMEAGSALLLKNPTALDPQCKGLVFGRNSQPKTALGMACQKRREITHEAETLALADTFRAQPAEFARRCTAEYYEMFSDDPVEAACGAVKDEIDHARDDKEHARLAQMTEAQIWVECEAKAAARRNQPSGVPMVEPYTPLASRCTDMRIDRDNARWKALEADPTKRAAVCASPFDQQEEWQQDGCYQFLSRQEDDAALEMARDHAGLVARCNATPVPQRDRILYKACDGYRKCLITRIDELPFDDASAYAGGARVVSDPAAACFDTVEQANAAFTEYSKDPKSLRANSCKNSESAQTDEYQAETCVRYAAGENVFYEAEQSLEGEDESRTAAFPSLNVAPPVIKKQ